MSRRIDLLRLDYLFSVLLPCIMAIYINNLDFLAHIDILVGFSLLAITGNTLNDAIDSKNPSEIETIKRIEGYHWKEIMTISIVAFVFGITMFFRTIQEHIQNLFILISIITCVLFYCLKKNIPIFNQVILVLSHVVLPYLMIKIDANSSLQLSLSEVVLLITFLFFALTGQLVHDVVDGDSLNRFKLKTQQIIILISSIITLFSGIVTIILFQNFYLIPIACVPIGILYTFRKPTRSTKGVKDVGIIIGNIVLFYFLVLTIY